jgi:hypothetical protein
MTAGGPVVQLIALVRVFTKQSKEFKKIIPWVAVHIDPMKTNRCNQSLIGVILIQKVELTVVVVCGINNLNRRIILYLIAEG